MAQTMYDAATAISSPRDAASFDGTPKDLAAWADSLKYYPTVENEAELTRYLWDAGKRLFYPRLTSKDQSHWTSTVLSRIPELKDSPDDVYIWKGGHEKLSPFALEDWRIEVENAALRRAREGEPVQASISPHLLKTVSGNHAHVNYSHFNRFSMCSFENTALSRKNPYFYNFYAGCKKAKSHLKSRTQNRFAAHVPINKISRANFVYNSKKKKRYSNGPQMNR